MCCYLILVTTMIPIRSGKCALGLCSYQSLLRIHRHHSWAHAMDFLLDSPYKTTQHLWQHTMLAELAVFCFFLTKFKLPEIPFFLKKIIDNFSLFITTNKTNPQGQGPRPFPICWLVIPYGSHRTMHLCLSVVCYFWAALLLQYCHSTDGVLAPVLAPVL